MATTVWFVPGWTRSQEPKEDVMSALTNAFPSARIEFKAWDGDNVVWPLAVESADKEVWRFAFEVAMMPQEDRENLVVVGHSLGGRITSRLLARLSERGLHIRQAMLLGAAIPYTDADLEKMGGASRLPVMAVCNPDDVTLRYIYAILGGEETAAFGANGTLKPVENVVEYVTPSNITERVSIDRTWAKSQFLKDICNHHEIFYVNYLGGILKGECPAKEVMVPQHLPTIKHSATDSETWWNVLAEHGGWKLEQHKYTTHCRILNPEHVCVAWGWKDEMTAAFEKVKLQVAPTDRDGQG